MPACQPRPRRQTYMAAPPVQTMCVCTIRKQRNARSSSRILRGGTSSPVLRGAAAAKPLVPPLCAPRTRPVAAPLRPAPCFPQWSGGSRPGALPDCAAQTQSTLLKRLRGPTPGPTEGRCIRNRILLAVMSHKSESLRPRDRAKRRDSGPVSGVLRLRRHAEEAPGEDDLVSGMACALHCFLWGSQKWCGGGCELGLPHGQRHHAAVVMQDPPGTLGGTNTSSMRLPNFSTTTSHRASRAACLTSKPKYVASRNGRDAACRSNASPYSS